jgi:hypothetical protein
MQKLQPADFLIGPRSGWRYFRGRWSGAYEGIRTVERGQGPFALCQHEPFVDGALEAKLTLHTASESASLAIRAAADGDDLRGYEIIFDPRRQRLTLRRHAAENATLAEAPVTIPTGQPLPVRIEAIGPRLSVCLGKETRPCLEVTDPKPLLTPGRVGVRAWGAALSIEDLVLRVGDHSVALTGDEADAPAPSVRALQAFCLLLLNLNEVVYVD